MANSSIVSNLKNKIIMDIIKEPFIVQAIDKTKMENPIQLINSNIFNFNKNPNTIQTNTTFITVQVHIPKVYDKSAVWVEPMLDIWVISSHDNMNTSDILSSGENRNDYISRLLDEKFNKKDGYADVGTIVLDRNVEGVHPSNNDFLFRQLLFKCLELNSSLCGDN